MGDSGGYNDMGACHPGPVLLGPAMTREEMARCFDCAQIYLTYPGLYAMLTQRDVMLCKHCIGRKVMDACSLRR